MEIVRFAMESKASVIVFEHLDMKKKKRGNKQKLSLWRKRDIQHRVEALAARNGIRVSYICAVNTSRLAFDGSGKVLRGKMQDLILMNYVNLQPGRSITATFPHLKISVHGSSSVYSLNLFLQRKSC